MDNNENIYYFTSSNSTIDVVYHNKVNTIYPVHTHAEHYIVGLVIDGGITIETQDDKYICRPDNIFTIPIDLSHSIRPLDNVFYTMVSICVHQDYLINGDFDDIK